MDFMYLRIFICFKRFLSRARILIEQVFLSHKKYGANSNIHEKIHKIETESIKGVYE